MVEQIERPGTWTFTRLPWEQKRYCAISRLQQLFMCHRAAGPTGFHEGPVFRGFTQRCSGAIGSNAMARRLTRVVQRLPVPMQPTGRSYTLHSFRHGRLQHEAAAGATYGDLQALSGIATLSVLQRYLDVGRHLC